MVKRPLIICERGGQFLLVEEDGVTSETTEFDRKLTKDEAGTS